MGNGRCWSWSSRRPASTIVLLLLVVSGNCPAVRAASLVYIQGGNVWLASPDGGTRRQVSVDGSAGAPYYSPSQADDGTIFAGWGSRVYRMNQAGTLQGAPIPTLISDKPPNVYAVGPFQPRVSPDGESLAYWIGISTGSYDPGCDCILTSPVESVVFARTDGTGTIGFSRFWQTPSWIDNTFVLLFAPSNRQTPQVGVGSLNALGNEQGWFNDDGEGFEGYWQDLDDGEIDRSGGFLALVRGVQAERLSIYVVQSFPSRPVLLCELGEPSGSFAGPTFSPDGTAIAWYENDGVWMSPIPADLGAPGSCAHFAPTLFAPGGSEPRWGLADVAPIATASPTTTPSSTASPTRTATISPSATPASSDTPNPQETVTPTPGSADSPTPSGTPTAEPTPPATATPGSACIGDCDGDHVVSVGELVRGVNIALTRQPLASCQPFDTNGDGAVKVDELIRAVRAALDGCVG